MDRPRSIPDQRGISKFSSDRTKPYSVTSYVAQYGLFWAEAEAVRDGASSHAEVDRRIRSLIAGRKELSQARAAWMAAGGYGNPPRGFEKLLEMSYKTEGEKAALALAARNLIKEFSLDEKDPSRDGKEAIVNFCLMRGASAILGAMPQGMSSRNTPKKKGSG